MNDPRFPGREAAVSIPEGLSQRDVLLLLEDNEPVAEMLSLVLRSTNLRIIRCGTGAQALATFTEYANRVALVLADCRLPDMDGREVCHRLRQLQPLLPVLVTSGNVSLRGLAPLEEAPMVCFLPKPYTPAEILSSVRGLQQAGARVAAA